MGNAVGDAAAFSQYLSETARKVEQRDRSNWQREQLLHHIRNICQTEPVLRAKCALPKTRREDTIFLAALHLTYINSCPKYNCGFRFLTFFEVHS